PSTQIYPLSLHDALPISVNVYCEKIVNDLREKFRAFSGQVQMAIELRQSQDRLEGIQDRLELYVDATMQMLNGSRGDWGDGMFLDRKSTRLNSSHRTISY